MRIGLMPSALIVSRFGLWRELSYLLCVCNKTHKIQCLRSALIAITDEDDGLPGQGLEIVVLIIEQSRRHLAEYLLQ